MTDAFHAPVRILVGLGFPQEICGAIDAVAYLHAVPISARDYRHSLALKACRAALRGEIEGETARVMFKAYAAKQGILAPADDDVLASRASSSQESHAL